MKSRVSLKHFATDCLWKPSFDFNSSQTPSNLISLTILVTLKSFTLFSCKFFDFFTKHFFTKHLLWLLLQRLSTKKYFRRKCFYITICMLYVLLVGVSKKKKIGKKVARSTKAAKNVEAFVQNMFFRQTDFSL